MTQKSEKPLDFMQDTCTSLDQDCCQGVPVFAVVQLSIYLFVKYSFSLEIQIFQFIHVYIRCFIVFSLCFVIWSCVCAWMSFKTIYYVSKPLMEQYIVSLVFSLFDFSPFLSAIHLQSSCVQLKHGIQYSFSWQYLISLSSLSF